MIIRPVMSLIKSKQSLILKYLSSKNLSLYNNYTINVNDVCRRHTSTTSTSKGQALSVSNLTGSGHLSPDEHKPKLDLSFENSQLVIFIYFYFFVNFIVYFYFFKKRPLKLNQVWSF